MEESGLWRKKKWLLFIVSLGNISNGPNNVTSVVVHPIYDESDLFPLWEIFILVPMIYFPVFPIIFPGNKKNFILKSINSVEVLL